MRAPARVYRHARGARKLQGVEGGQTPTMRATEGPAHAWARLRVDVNCALRRGAWYPVVRLARDKLILEVTGERVPVPRRLLRTMFQRPNQWTIVQRPGDAANVPPDWGTRYAVCPACHARSPISDFPADMRCPHCRGVYGIAWDEHYLSRKG
jgi:hypothetical protein